MPFWLALEFYKHGLVLFDTPQTYGSAMMNACNADPLAVSLGPTPHFYELGQLLTEPYVSPNHNLLIVQTFWVRKRHGNSTTTIFIFYIQTEILRHYDKITKLARFRPLIIHPNT